jgi:hypothetical protein
MTARAEKMRPMLDRAAALGIDLGSKPPPAP